MREASNAAAEPRRSITASRTSVRPLQVIHTGAPRLIKSLGVLAPPDPRRLIFFNLHKVEEGQDSLALLVCTPRGNTKIILFLRTFLRNISPRIQNFRENSLRALALNFSEFLRRSVHWRGAPQGPFYRPFPPPYSGNIPYSLFTLAPGWNPVHTGAWFKTLFTLAPGSKPCSHWRPDPRNIPWILRPVQGSMPNIWVPFDPDQCAPVSQTGVQCVISLCVPESD